VFSESDNNILFLLTTRYGLEQINPITISSIGGTLSLLSIAIFLNKQIKGKALLFIGIAVGLLLLMLGASRGPFIFSVLISLILLIVHYRNIGFKFLHFIYLGIISFIVIFSMYTYVIPFYKNYDFAMLSRLDSYMEDKRAGGEEERDYIYRSALTQFMDHPIIGDSYLEETSGYYPHNIIIEALMATGLVGGVFFIFSVVIALFQMNTALRVNRKGHFYVYFVSFSMIILLSQTSGSLFSSPELWAFWPIILNGNFHNDSYNIKTVPLLKEKMLRKERN
jgi:O-antigen ligase